MRKFFFLLKTTTVTLTLMLKCWNLSLSNILSCEVITLGQYFSKHRTTIHSYPNLQHEIPHYYMQGLYWISWYKWDRAWFVSLYRHVHTVQSVIHSLKLVDYLSVWAHKPCSFSLVWPFFAFSRYNHTLHHFKQTAVKWNKSDKYILISWFIMVTSIPWKLNFRMFYSDHKLSNSIKYMYNLQNVKFPKHILGSLSRFNPKGAKKK